MICIPSLIQGHGTNIPCSLIIKKGIRNWKSTITHVCPTTVWGYGWGGCNDSKSLQTRQRVTQESLKKCSLGALCNLYPSFFISTQINIAPSLGRTKSLRGDFSQASLWTGEREGQVKKSNHGKQFNSFAMLQCIPLHSLAPERKPFFSF